MAFREVHMIELKEVLRLWIRGRGLRAVSEATGVDRKTVRRYVEAGRTLGLTANSDEGQLADSLLGAVFDLVRPSGPGVHGESWELCVKHRDFLQDKVDLGLKLTKVQALLHRHVGHEVPYSTFGDSPRQSWDTARPRRLFELQTASLVWSFKSILVLWVGWNGMG
jgi:hypothetical protein